MLHVGNWSLGKRRSRPCWVALAHFSQALMAYMIPGNPKLVRIGIHIGPGANHHVCGLVS